jgi:hypothetical protein
MNIESTLVLFTVVAALGLVGVGVVAVNIIPNTQEAEAKGCSLTSPAANTSRGFCIKPQCSLH